MQVLQIKPMEQVQLDQDRLGALYSQLGPAGAENVVCRALEELAYRLAHCTALYQAKKWDELRKNTRSLVAIAEQVGMSALSHVAGDVTYCLDRADWTGVASTLSRMIRVGERSLTAVWDIQDFSI